MASNLAIILTATNKASATLRQVSGDLDALGRKGTSTGDRLSKALGIGLKAAAGVGIAAIAGLGATLTKSVKSAADMEAGISGIAAILGKTNEEVQPLKDAIVELGLDPNLKVNATEAAAAMEMLARNGLNMTQILDGAAHSTVLLANATGSDFGTAADIATDVMALFNIEVRDMNKAVNGITSVVRNSKFSIDDYRLALAQGGGVAASVGVAFDDFNTAIAAIAPLFASGSDAGTSFKTLLQRLVPVSGPAGDAMVDLGIKVGETNKFFDESTGQMKSMAEIAQVLNDAMRDLSEQDRVALFSKAFGTDAMRAAFGLAGMTADQFRALQEQMAQTDAFESARTRMDNLSGSMEILGGIVDAIFQQVGDIFLPYVRDMTDALIQFLSDNQEQIVGSIEKFVEDIRTGFAKVRVGIILFQIVNKDQIKQVADAWNNLVTEARGTWALITSILGYATFTMEGDWFGFVHFVIAQATLLTNTITQLLAFFWNVITLNWGEAGRNLLNLWNNMLAGMTNTVEFVFGPNIAMAMENAINGAWAALIRIWERVVDWWNFTALPALGGLFGPFINLAIPEIKAAPRSSFFTFPDQSTGQGGTTQNINVTVNAINADPGNVQRATIFGVRDAMQAVGMP